MGCTVYNQEGKGEGKPHPCTGKGPPKEGGLRIVCNPEGMREQLCSKRASSKVGPWAEHALGDRMMRSGGRGWRGSADAGAGNVGATLYLQLNTGGALCPMALRQSGPVTRLHTTSLLREKAADLWKTYSSERLRLWSRDHCLPYTKVTIVR